MKTQFSFTRCPDGDATIDSQHFVEPLSVPEYDDGVDWLSGLFWNDANNKVEHENFEPLYHLTLEAK